MPLGIKALIVPNALMVGKDLIVAVDTVKAVVKIIQVDAVEKEAMGENMEEVEVVAKKGVKANFILTPLTLVPVIFVISQAILRQIVLMPETLRRCLQKENIMDRIVSSRKDEETMMVMDIRPTSV